MFGVVLTTAATVVHAYVCWRAWTVPYVNSRISGRTMIGLTVALWLIMYLGRTWARDGGTVFKASLELFAMNWIGALFLLFLPLLIADVITAFGFLWGRWAIVIRGAALAAGLLMAALAMVQGIRAPVVRHHEVRLEGLPAELDGTVLVALSDTHLGSLIGAHWMRARVEQVEALQPDIVVLLGDILEGHGTDWRELAPVLSELSAPLGVWVVLGNHEFHGDHTVSVEAFERAGFGVLRNESAELRPGLVLAGLDYAWSWDEEETPVAAALEDAPPGARVLLSHAPVRAENAARAGVGLMLSGHTHGGQIWPFNYLVKRRYPLIQGRYEVNGMTVLVCRGTGTWGPRMRLWRPGEMLHVILRGTEVGD